MLVIEQAHRVRVRPAQLLHRLRNEEVLVHPAQPVRITQCGNDRIGRVRFGDDQAEECNLARRCAAPRGLVAALDDSPCNFEPRLPERLRFDELHEAQRYPCRAMASDFDHLIDELERSYKEVQERMCDPSVYNDHREAADVGRKLKELEGPYKLALERRSARDDLASARDDAELRELVPELEARTARLEEALRLAMVPTDPADSKDVIMEVRQGGGGDEAALWAGDLYRMLARYAERRGYKVEELEASPSDGGGYKEVTFAIKGDGAYSVFKWEGGTHRVQRVPETEAQGRIHTSTATVAVMPEAEEVEVNIDPNDLKIDVYRSTGPGGQSVNTTDSAVRITHLPTGVVVSMQDEKSQLQNKDKAMRVLRARLYERELERQRAELDATRRSQIGTGVRAEKIRTYNFPENRLTDHRIKLTVHQLDRILQGELDEFTDALATEDRRRALEA